MRTAAVLLGLSLLACGQEDALLPDGGVSEGAGDCGSWYPGSSEDAGAGSLAVAEGAVFPCLVWESGRQKGEDAYLNAGELYLRVKHGLTDAKALVIVVGARNCAACEELIEAVAGAEDDFESAGAVMAGTCRTDLRDQKASLTIDEAEDVLVKGDGWPEEWFITNDNERYLPAIVDSYTPWVIVVRLEDMRVMELSNDKYFASNIEDLIDFIGKL